MNFTMTSEQLINADMKSQILFGMIMLVILCSGGAWYLYNKPGESFVTGDPVYSVSASELFVEFEADAAAADKKYLNRIIAVTGQIADIRAVDSVGVNVTLSTGTSIFGVSCRISDPREANGLRNGQLIRVKGLCTGVLMDVVLVKCVIEKK
jgi:hypothetical protein